MDCAGKDVASKALNASAAANLKERIGAFPPEIETVGKSILNCGVEHNGVRPRQFDVRFSKPVFPGETLVVELWQDGSTISYRASVKERPGTVVLNNGLCRLA